MHWICFFIGISCFLSTCESLPGFGQITELPDFGVLPSINLAGYLAINVRAQSYLYYWFIESETQPADAPIVVWLNGGPGAPSMMGLFTENGPYSCQGVGKIGPNPYSWTKVANMLYIDQPAGTGFSFTTSFDGYARNETDVADDLYAALQVFFTRYPQYQKNDLYIFGESYGGKYVPAISLKIHEENSQKQNGSVALNLKGFGLGDGWTDPLIQNDYGAAAYANGLIDENQKVIIDTMYNSCQSAILASDWKQAYNACTSIWDSISEFSGKVDFYDVRKFGGGVNYDFAAYLLEPKVVKAIYADHIFSIDLFFVDEALKYDMQIPIVADLPTLLNNYRALIYNGQFDLICNLMGVQSIYYQMDGWSQLESYRNATRVVWKVDGKVAGYVRSVPNFDQVIVCGAGHMSPADQPQNTLDMLNRFLFNKPWD